MIRGAHSMTRLLLLVAGTGFVATLICFAVVAALGPVPWHNLDFHDDDDFGSGRGRRTVDGGGPTVTREFAWGGGDELTVALPAEITFTQGPEARLTVTGQQGAVDQVEVDDDTLRFDRRVRDAGRLRIVMTAPNIRVFNLHGAQTLNITGLDQDDVEIAVRGAGEVTAAGRARRLELQIAGAGEANLAGLETEDAEIQIAGAGEATVTARRSADVQIAGAGEVNFTVRPQQLETQIFGAGDINQPDPAPAAPSAPASSNAIAS